MPQFFASGSDSSSSHVCQPRDGVPLSRIGAGRRILVVDDEPPITETLSAIFTHSGFTVRAAHSAEEAIETMAVWEPDLAILDVMLPHMNGIELALVVRDNHPRCRLVLFSGNIGTQALAEEAARRGNCFQILSKPVHPLFMLDYVASLLTEPSPLS